MKWYLFGFFLKLALQKNVTHFENRRLLAVLTIQHITYDTPELRPLYLENIKLFASDMVYAKRSDIKFINELNQTIFKIVFPR